MAHEDHVDLLVLAGEEQVQQCVEALGEVLLLLVHRGRDVHEAEHHRLRDRLRHGDAVAVAQVDVVEERHRGEAPLVLGDLHLHELFEPLGIVLERKRGELGARVVVLALDARAQGDAAAERVAQRPHHREVGGRPVAREAGALELAVGDAAGDVAREVRQLQVVEEELHELLARERELEAVRAVALARAAFAALALPPLGALDAVALVEGAVARVDHLAVAAVAVPERGLGDVLDRDANAAAVLHVLDGAVGDHPVDRALDLLAVAADEALPVGRALVLVVEPSVDDHGHGRSPVGDPSGDATATATSSRAGTTRTTGAPASRCSPSRPCGRRSSRASCGPRPTPWR